MTPRPYSELKQMIEARGFGASPCVAELLEAVRAHEGGSGRATLMDASVKRLRVVAISLGLTSAVCLGAAVWAFGRVNDVSATNLAIQQQAAASRKEATEARADLDTKTQQFRSAIEAATRSSSESVNLLKEQFAQMQTENSGLRKQVQDLQAQLAKATPPLPKQ